MSGEAIDHERHRGTAAGLGEECSAHGERPAGAHGGVAQQDRPRWDRLVGDAGANTLVGLAGMDLLDGKAGIDTVSYAEDAAFGGPSGVLVDLAAGIGVDGFGDWDTLVSIENLTGSNAGTQ